MTTLSLDYTVVDASQNLVEASASWANAAERWHIIHWGDGSEVGYYGTSGSQAPQHVYNPGTYNMTLTVIGADGQTYTDTETITIGG